MKFIFIIIFLIIISSVMKSMHSFNIALHKCLTLSCPTYFRMFCVVFSFRVSLTVICVVYFPYTLKTVRVLCVYMKIHVVYIIASDDCILCRNTWVSNNK
jgi:hypothetical protein